MDGACFQHRPTGYPVTVERLRLTKGKSEGSGVCTGHHEVAIAKEDGGVQRLAEASGACDDRIQHGLDISRRAADDLQDLRGRGLLLQGFPQLVEKPRVLDRDDGLTGEILDEGDLLVGERPHLLTINPKRAGQPILVEHGHYQHGAGTGRLDERYRRWLRAQPVAFSVIFLRVSSAGMVRSFLSCSRRARVFAASAAETPRDFLKRQAIEHPIGGHAAFARHLNAPMGQVEFPVEWASGLMLIMQPRSSAR